MDDIVTHLNANVSIALVGGDPSVRRARQIILRSEQYDVRSYASCPALLADPRSRDCACIIADTLLHELDGIELLRIMRADGWRGKGILLDATTVFDGETRQGDMVLYRAIGDGPLIGAVRACIRGASE